ncbi:MAG: biotin--[acetyl-CoA-carboxylase] ligase [Planctomycetota bacterium]
MNVEAVDQALTTRRFGRRLFYQARVDSTMRRAAAVLQQKALPEGAVFVADEQSRGRGTAGRVWHSEREGLWLSCVFQEPLRAQPLSFLPGIALVDVLREHYGVDAHVKWPNDVLVGNRKISGSLGESQRQPDGRTAWVLGVGINVNQAAFAPPIHDVAVSLRLATGQMESRELCLARFLGKLEELYDGATDLVAEWRRRTQMLGRTVTAIRAGQEQDVQVLDLTPEGHLVVALPNGVRETLVAAVDLRLRV